MDNMPKSRVMSKTEIALLLDLIQSNPVLTSKETNASTNKIKEELWTTLVSTFNANNGSNPRTKEQLKLKWDNLKKAARKRTQLIRMNNLKTSGGKPDFIAPDETLDKVAIIMESNSTGFVVPFGGDGVGCSSKDEDAGPLERKRKIEALDVNSPTATTSKKVFGWPMSEELNIKKNKRKPDNDGRLARNLAIARFYDKRTEKINIEIKLLKLELEQRQRREPWENS